MGDEAADTNSMTDENTGSYQIGFSVAQPRNWKEAIFDVCLHFASRKLFFAIASVFLVVEGVSRVSKLGMPEGTLIVVLPFMITAITVVCVTYLTGQAKVDIQANLTANASAELKK